MSTAREVYKTEPGIYAVETRNKGARKATDTHRKELRALGKKPAVPKMKSSRPHDQALMPSIEDEDKEVLLRHRAIVEIHDDTPMKDAQVDPLREPVGGLATPASIVRWPPLDLEEVINIVFSLYRSILFPGR